MINHTLMEVYKQKAIRYYGFSTTNFMTLNSYEQDLLLYNYLSMQKGDSSTQVKQEIGVLGNDFNKVIEREHQMKEKVKMLLRKRG